MARACLYYHWFDRVCLLSICISSFSFAIVTLPRPFFVSFAIDVYNAKRQYDSNSLSDTNLNVKLESTKSIL